MLLWFLTPWLLVLSRKIRRAKKTLMFSVTFYLFQVVCLIGIWLANFSEQRWMMYINPIINLSIYMQGILWGRKDEAQMECGLVDASSDSIYSREIN
jgi:hypothetical protein